MVSFPRCDVIVTHKWLNYNRFEKRIGSFSSRFVDTHSPDFADLGFKKLLCAPVIVSFSWQHIAVWLEIGGAHTARSGAL